MAEDMEHAKEMIRTSYADFNRGDFDAAAKHLHPEVEWNRVAEVETPLGGRDEVRENMKPNVLERQHTEIKGMEVIGESIVLDTVFHATGAGSGIQLDQVGFHVWKIDGGMGRRFQYFTERHEAVAAARSDEGLA